MQLQKLLKDHPVLAMSALRSRDRDAGMSKLHVIAEERQLPEMEFRMELMLRQGADPNTVILSSNFFLGGVRQRCGP